MIGSATAVFLIIKTRLQAQSKCDRSETGMNVDEEEREKEKGKERKK